MFKKRVAPADSGIKIDTDPRPEYALAAPAVWGDEEPDPSTFEQVDIRPYYANRGLYRTLKRKALRAIGIRRTRGSSRMPRRRVHKSRARCRSPGRLAADDEPDDVDAVLPVAGAA